MQHPYAQFVHLVQRPARYIGGEYGEIRKRWEDVCCRICLAFPDLYELGMSHLGIKILYSTINRHPDLLAERVFAPWFDMEAELRKRREPLRSLESARPLSDFDVLGFSLQFELAFTNIVQMLDLGGIPLRSSDRGEPDPLVLAGGPGAVHPEPIAPFIDAFVIGDGEEAAVEILLLYGRLKREGVARTERLRALAQLPGVYVPSLYQTQTDARTGLQYISGASDRAALPVRRTTVSDLDRYPFPTDGPVPDSELAFDRASVEIARGCTEGCRFCQAGAIYRPVRERSPGQIVEVIDQLVRTSGYESASLTSLSTADYSAIVPLIRELSDKLRDEQVSLVVSSLRAYGLAPEVLDYLRRGRATGLTFALEAGSQRLRDVINKNVTEEQMLETARQVFSHGWDKIKLYFMIGLPTESDDDVVSIITASARIRQVGRQLRGRRAEVVVNVSTHVPKPHTPFQWFAMDSLSEVERKQALLKEEARRAGLTLRLHNAPASWLEAVLARGDRAVADVIESAFRRGARFDSWSEHLQLELWKLAFTEAGIDPNRYLYATDLHDRLPWDHIDIGVDTDFFRDQHRKALAARPSPPCGRPAPGAVGELDGQPGADTAPPLVCYRCGIGCDLTALQTGRHARLQDLYTKTSSLSEPRSDSLNDATPVPREPSKTYSADVSDKPGAKSPVEPATPAGPTRSVLPVHDESDRGRKPVLRDELAPAASRGANLLTNQEPVRVRLGYTKLGRAVYASHLDLIRGLTRICRRAGLPLYYTQGFHPKALMSFAPALSVGIASLCEYVDIALRESQHVDWEGLVDRLSGVSPDGIRFFSARKLAPGDPKLSGVINKAVYVAGIAGDFLQQAGLGEIETLRERIEQRKKDNLEVTRVIESTSKVVNVSQFLEQVLVDQGAQSLERAGFAANLVPVTLHLRITDSGTAKVSEALNALLDLPETPAQFVRSELLWSDKGGSATPMDLEMLKSLCTRKAKGRSAKP